MPYTHPHPALAASAHLIPSLKDYVSASQSHFLKHGGYLSLNALKLYYARADPLHSAISICGFFTVYCYVMQQITGNASQVDGLWTFLPAIYGAHFAFQKQIASLIDPPKLGFLTSSKGQALADNVDPRLALMFGLQILWSARLTYNAIRRGMFKKGEEDYRWPILRQGMSRLSWEIFTLVFIATIQNILLACTALPQYMILTAKSYKVTPAPRPSNQLTTGDFVIAGLLVLNLTIQFIADQQQWNYQNYKRGKDPQERKLPESVLKKIEQDPDVKRGFVTSGLWAYSRHPNFACEQTTWWILWLYVPWTFLPAQPSHGVQAYLNNYALASPLIMNILFIASTRFSEDVSSGKYPAYAAYKKRVGMFLPFPDTLLRSVYYNFIASKESKAAVDEQVWGDSAKVKSA